MPKDRLRAFTIIEMLVVLTAVGLMVAVAAPAYVVHIDRARDTALKQNLRTMRDALDQFHADKGRYASSLQELVAERYLRELPVDPVTQRADSWVQINASEGGVMDVRSGAQGASKEGGPYAAR